MPRHLISDAHEWINEIPTVPIYYTVPIIRKDIKVMQLNCMRSKAVSSEVRHIVDTKGFDLVCLTEPYSSNGVLAGPSMSAKVIMGSNNETQAAITVHSPDIEVLKLSQFCDKHCVCTEIRSSLGTFYVVNVYFQYNQPIQIHLDKLNRIMRALSGRQLVILGDFNARSTVWHDRLTDDNGRDVEDFVERNDLYILNEEGSLPTYSHNGESCIDLTLVTGGMLGKIKNWTVSEGWTSSDHRAISFEIDQGSNDRTVMGCHKERFAFNKACWTNVLQVLSQKWSNLDSTTTLSSKEDIDGFNSLITKYLIDACNQTIPKKGPRKRVRGWWNDDLTQAKKQVAKLRRSYQREINPEIKIHKRKVYATTRNKYFKSIEITRQISFERYVSEHGNKDPWGLVYKYQSQKIRPSESLSSVKNNNTVTQSWAETARVLLQELLPDDEYVDSDYLRTIESETAIDPDTEDDSEFGPHEIELALMSMKRGKAPGLDRLEVEFLQKTWCITWQSITLLLNSCLKLGIFPSTWKRGEVIIIKKAGDKDPMDPKAYRPIMLLPVIGKLFEKLLAKRIMSRVESSGLFSAKQYGFRQKRSTENAIVDLVSSVTNSNAKYVLGIFLDISGAFDNLWWPSVMTDLKRFNCPKNIYQVIRNYFEGRSAVIKDKYESISKQVTKGCPQGSILGPYIWNIVFNGSMNDEVHEVAFADDKVILIEGSSRSELERKGQMAIDSMIEWCNNTKLKLSSEKTVILQLKGKYDSKRPPQIKVNNTNLKMVTSVKYLGVDLDERLGVTTHVNRITDKAKKITHALGRLAREKWGLKPKTLKTIYKSVVESILTYASEGWFGRTNCHHKRKLESAQRCALLKMTRGYRTTSGLALQVVAGVIPIDIFLNERSLLYKFRSGGSVIIDGSALSIRHTSKAIAKKVLRLESLKKWQDRWDEGTDGRATYEFLPDVQKVHSGQVPLSGSVVQIITGHGKTRKYLKRLGITSNEQCDCGSDEQSINHILYECELMNVPRYTFSDRLSLLNCHWPLPKTRLMDEDILPEFKLFAQQIITELNERLGY